ncbi:hypothetical protein BGZ80_009660 [Entomortierella chlamydospora]|uniref:F-box domain-containing protein n=1 Tax=Entomortierella chlamydospora TaxID=101097 RepID=A0A9P6MWJ1_9FUNG|nr:hypothetical protein BGZ80_009660 [Entomortierella chlamydospora]
MSRSDPIHLPEITALIAKHLDRQDLTRCLRVCKAWFNSFLILAWSACGSGMVNGLTFPNMRNLHLEFAIDDGLEIEDQFYVIKHSPRLNCLTWLSEAADKAESKEFGNLLKQGAWPHLKSLVLLIDMQDDDVALMLDGLNSPTNLGLAWSMFGPCAFKSIRRHLDTLRELDISGCSLRCFVFFPAAGGIQDWVHIGEKR